ncbi:hypothetical protein ACFVDU_17595 [Streptomyces albidoflavus]
MEQFKRPGVSLWDMELCSSVLLMLLLVALLLLLLLRLARGLPVEWAVLLSVIAITAALAKRTRVRYVRIRQV